jgi:hypothetical protein
MHTSGIFFSRHPLQLCSSSSQASVRQQAGKGGAGQVVAVGAVQAMGWSAAAELATTCNVDSVLLCYDQAAGLCIAWQIQAVSCIQ